jgi:hypothetical protein
MGGFLLDFDCKGNPDFTLGARIERANRAVVLRGKAADACGVPFSRN